MKTRMLLLVAVALAAKSATAQVVLVPAHGRVLSVSSYLVVPQTRSFVSSTAPAGRVEVSEVDVGVAIAEQVATTTMDISITNPGSSRLEAQMIIPVPEGAVLRGFTFQGSSAEPTAELLTKEEARRTYDAIVAKVRDPAILEFIGCNLIQSSVFPVAPRSGQKVRAIYEHLLPRDGERVDFVLPRTESLDYRIPWHVTVKIKSKVPISTVYSPSHRIEMVRENGSMVTAMLSAGASSDPGPFRISYLLQHAEMAASLLAYPDARVGGGYFLLLAGAPGRPAAAPPMKREMILVIDRSGSMAGEKLEQVRAAALQVLEGLDDGESFNLIVYNEAVESFAPEPVVKNDETMRAARAFVRGLRVRGGTDIYDALQEALRMKATRDTLPIVLFLTDGLPTVGQTSEKAIRELAAKGNPQHRRVFTFGVGVDVNTPLLDKIALETRGASTFVLPKEDIEVKVGQIFKRLSGPVLAEPTLQARDAEGKPLLGRVQDVLPSQMPDIFEGDQCVVLGQYRGDEPLAFELHGNYAGRERTFRFRFELDKATTKNAFVPRLWASRKIAALTDAIRDLGADGGPVPGSVVSASDPRLKELVDEVVRLSKEFGILSEYTAFLAREGTDLTRSANVLVQAADNFSQLAVNTRVGWNSVNQSINNGFARSQAGLNGRNLYYDANLNRVEISTVQQVNDRAFYNRGNRWVDSSLLDETNSEAPRVITVGSEEFRALMDRLTAENRQGAVALKGEILLRVGKEKILIK
jgi:Ca-activated chloride channel homolog